MESNCVDWDRKPPKYLCEVPNKAAKADLYCVLSVQQPQHHEENILDTTHHGNKVTESEASLEGQIQDRGRDASEEVFDEIIDPTFYTECPNFTFEDHAFVGSILEGKDNFAPFFRNAQYSPWAGVSSSESKHTGIETPHQSPENIPGDSSAEPHTFEILGPQTLTMDSYDEYAFKSYESDGSSYGFAISSGWSSTFFPCGIEEEPRDR
ncbi:hypothetical protein N7474_009146 [Penicillium riverlandense]|uniref:uncharacterized protein n=1 Tax=Penicillium riverlandense TaxID=1903569 RepID=UPI0025472A36|nr:uncharacterized protein N7474_009146 [Penicillium riverlandense]KAJ5807877.1 hypothetical protein N7474_009146 [Penicillium riverlandense]